jgi:hypothetical protein
MAPDPEAERRAAALEALKISPPPRSEAESFWQQHGGKIVGAVALLLGLWLVSRAVGGFMQHSLSESERAQEDLRRGLKR